MGRGRLMAIRRVGTALAFLLGSAGTMLAQQLDVEVRASGSPLQGALVKVIRGAQGVAPALTDARGRVRIAVPAGSYDIRVDGIGYEGVTRRDVRVAAGIATIVTVDLVARPLIIADLEVLEDRRQCRVEAGEGSVLAGLWDAARTNLELLVAARGTQGSMLRITAYTRVLDGEGVTVEENAEDRTGRFLQPFGAADHRSLIVDGFVQRSGRDWVFYAPDAPLLLSDDFARSYCFQVASPRHGRVGADSSRLVGIRFRPQRTSRPGIAGTFWLDRETGYLISVDFAYVGLRMTADVGDRAGGRLSFRKLSDGLLVIDDWWIRMPRIARVVGAGLRADSLVGFQEIGARVAEPGDRRELGAVVMGRVADPVTGAPLAGARVGIGSGRPVSATDSAGRFALRTERAGRYALQVFHPRLELIGHSPLERVITVEAGDTVRVALEAPGSTSVLANACPGAPVLDSGSLIAARFVDSLRTRVPGLEVAAQWQDVSGSGPRITVEEREMLQVTDRAGIARFCDVPTVRPVVIAAPVGRPRHRFPADRPRLALLDSVLVRD